MTVSTMIHAMSFNSSSAVHRWMADETIHAEAADLLPVGATILVPLDFSPLSQMALETAAVLAGGRPDVTLRLVHVVNHGCLNLDSRIESATAQLNRVRPGISCAARVESRVTSGWPTLKLREACDDGEVSLVVMSSHGRTGLARMIMGSVAERLMEDAPVSVLVVKPRLDKQGRLVPAVPTFRHLIVGYNHSEGAERALTLAQGVARRFRSRVTLVHAVDPLEVPPTPSFCQWGRAESVVHEAEEALHEVCARNMPESAEWETIAAVGAPRQILVETARDAVDDLVIVGPHVFTRWGHAVSDSSTIDVARMAPCGVLVAR